MRESDDDSTLYRIDIRTPASPAEVAAFTDLLESSGYEVVTDLEHGKLEVREGEEDANRADPNFDIDINSIETDDDRVKREIGKAIDRGGSDV